MIQRLWAHLPANVEDFFIFLNSSGNCQLQKMSIICIEARNYVMQDKRNFLIS